MTLGIFQIGLSSILKYPCINVPTDEKVLYIHVPGPRTGPAGGISDKRVLGTCSLQLWLSVCKIRPQIHTSNHHATYLEGANGEKQQRRQSLDAVAPWSWTRGSGTSIVVLAATRARARAMMASDGGAAVLFNHVQLSAYAKMDQ